MIPPSVAVDKAVADKPPVSLNLNGEYDGLDLGNCSVLDGSTSSSGSRADTDYLQQSQLPRTESNSRS